MSEQNQKAQSTALWCLATGLLTAAFLLVLDRFMYLDLSGLKRVPTSAWTTFAIAVVAFGGVVLTTYTHRAISQRQLTHDATKFADQLAHDTRERGREINAELRHEVYVELAAEVSKASSIFGRMGKFDYNEKNISDELAGLGEAVAKVALVADQETAFAAERFYGSYMRLLMELLPEVAPAARLMTQAKILKERYEIGVEHIKYLSDKHRSKVGEPSGTADALEQLASAVMKQAEYARAAEGAWRKAEDDRHQAEMKFIHVFFDRHAALIESRVEVQYLIRRDLGLVCDKSAMLSEAYAAQEAASTGALRVLGLMASEKPDQKPN